MDLGIRGQTALVTGASRGLGRAIALALAAEGARVALGYRRERAQAEEAAEACRAAGAPAAMAHRLDASSEDDVGRFVDAAARQLGPPTILVNNGAVCPRGPATSVERAAWDEVLAVNLTGTFLLCRELLRRLGEARSPGRIVNVASTAAFHGSTSGQVAYDASKGGIVSLTISLAREAAPLAVTVNAIAPGLMLTDMMAEKYRADPERYLARVPLRRLAAVEEVAAAAVFLASRQASYMTGTVVNVSGGLLMG
ncbi:MAG TPA: SDR family NAD(P)-dependent oxidoreductase [Anaeromyxobacteraceae bacterium]|nr:SDR family NAD(P)-dependent oxidoreductase [Anaeromyxobacteraceae bacterium]